MTECKKEKFILTTRIQRYRLTDRTRDELVRRLKDTLAWPQWSSMEAAVIERPGADGPSSPGEIRRFTRGGTTGREEVLDSAGDVVLRYRLIEGLPLRNYVGEVAITEDNGRRRVQWSASFDAPFLTGWIFAISMGRFFDSLLKDLTEARA